MFLHGFVLWQQYITESSFSHWPFHLSSGATIGPEFPLMYQKYQHLNIQNAMKFTHFHFGHSVSFSPIKTLQITHNISSGHLLKTLLGLTLNINNSWVITLPLLITLDNSKWFDRPSMHDSSFYGWPVSTLRMMFLLLLSLGIHDSSAQSISEWYSVRIQGVVVIRSP